MRGLPKHPGAPGPLPVRRPWGSSWPLPLQHRGVLEVPIPVMSPSLQHPHPHGVSHPCRPASGDSTVGEGDERPKLEPGRSTAGSKRERLGRLPQGRRLARPRCRTNTPARTTPSQNPEHAPLRAQKKKKTPTASHAQPCAHPPKRTRSRARTHTHACNPVLLPGCGVHPVPRPVVVPVVPSAVISAVVRLSAVGCLRRAWPRVRLPVTALRTRPRASARTAGVQACACVIFARVHVGDTSV